MNAVSFDSHYFEYQQASKYTHLNWSESIPEKISVQLTPIQNFSGLPVEARKEKKDYFYHGKLPLIINNIYQDAFVGSRYFIPTRKNADYRIELILDQYQLPYEYAPDDEWWTELHDQTDRWFQSPGKSAVNMTIKVSSGLRKIETWMESVEMVMSNCDLNSQPQPQTWINNQDKISQIYLSTTPGQTFLAATNFLVLKTIQKLNKQSLLGVVERISGDELYLSSQSARFTNGELLDLYFNDQYESKSEVSAGQVRVIKASFNYAMAYPVNLRADHIKVGDWVDVRKAADFDKPPSIFVPAEKCASVVTAEVN